ncbi:MAG TPA: HisA/HisF-related TIM barrel protein [Gammaproteobacteria bacterium]|nr:HisA/HisF-related TIM barrel protein [Gammaproteobacteria bacterium]
MSALELIPVIDVMDGRAVHARGDNARSSYSALHTRLCPDSDPLAVADAFVSLHAFRTFYVADLNAITGTGDNFELIQRLHQHHPAVELWVDAGIRHRDDYRRLQEQGFGVPVLGSETLAGADALRQMIGDHDRGAVLSLDYRGRHFIGPAALDTAPDLWPQRVIVMSLGRIAGSRGPEMERVQDVVERSAGRQVFAAGGVRDEADLRRLQRAGVRGVLLASALHTGRLDGNHLSAYR